jgi:hypothetical protein
VSRRGLGGSDLLLDLTGNEQNRETLLLQIRKWSEKKKNKSVLFINFRGLKSPVQRFSFVDLFLQT